ncbi:cobalamin biosynthesis protein [Rhodoplanes sp.]|uniref:cobalamin biosynthesis protein n=1 Tax=Rhodoplanes sp. TaxID=1968906 RepID=UPI0025DB72FA|nr:cobalamin biosynthesis protein [Rhodoplanes sp.]
MVAGVGFRRDASAAEILAAVRLALDVAGVADKTLDALATAAFKAEEVGAHEAAAHLKIPLIVCAPPEMERVADKTFTRSARVQAAVGVPSVAEAAALAAAGPGSKLLGARVATKTATCAIAIGAGP